MFKNTRVWYLWLILTLSFCCNGNSQQLQRNHKINRQNEPIEEGRESNKYTHGFDEPETHQHRNNKNGTAPNIILILADDLGYGDLSFSGHPTSRTPHVDHLARTGRYFTQFYVTSPVCSPSRASVLTGRLQIRSGVYPGTFIPDNILGLPHNETTIAALLKTKGYRTMIAGKWHLGVGIDREYLPTHYGFDEYLGVPYSHDMCPCLSCFPHNRPCYDTCWHWDVSCPLFSNTTIVEQPVDLTSLTQTLINHAINFIDTPATQPYFLYLPFHHVHHPQFASSAFTGVSERGRFGDALAELDWAVAQVVGALRRKRQLDSTLIWFTSDNGPSLTRHERGGSAGPLRCGKGTTWEGGVRVPTFVHWPQKVLPGRTTGLASTLDILPTLASLINLNISHLTLDGTDITPLLLDPHVKSPREYMAIYPESPNATIGPYAVTNGTYKAHFYTQGSDLSDADNYDPVCPGRNSLTQHMPPLLYQLHHDPGERYNLANHTQYSSVIEEFTRWRDEHMKSVTWMAERTSITQSRAQPCCTDSTCNPFPTCCDCPPPPPTTTTTTTTMNAVTNRHPNHIASFDFGGK